MDGDSTNMNENTGDAFDGSAEPTVYMWDNRMAVVMEFYSTFIYIIFGAFILALVFILPGVRRTKLTSFLCLLSQIIVCAAILLALEETSWLTGNVQLNDRYYSAGSRARFSGDLGINIGLSSVNVTLLGSLSTAEEENHESIDYNERFYFDEPERMQSEHNEALKKGLPYPILTVTDLLKQDSEGFNWSRQLRQAGKFTSLMLYLSLASWLVTVIIMCVIPTYLPHMMQITGSLILGSSWLYTVLVSSPILHNFQFGEDIIQLSFGFTAVTTFSAGAFSLFAGILLLFIQLNNPLKQFTIMDSEQFVKDQKVLYRSNILNHLALDIKPAKMVVESVSSPSSKVYSIKNNKTEQTQSNSVIIPMADIEENFNNSQ